ncbi:MAG: hypothetical protein H0S79_26185 [Anaerolineaceae bacterium]|nr:hypothetical protein [Anaerolineaceae bacterium]
MTHHFEIGKYRPIYLWGGPGTIRMNRVKFMNYPVDEAAHLAVHEEKAAKVVVEEMDCNWVHLMYDWGFPPEVEEEDWEDFRKGAETYHHLGSPVFAYIQSSNCVYDGSFVEKDWYAKDTQGRKVYYYSGRYMVDWTHPEWIRHLKDLAQGALERGADGIFFDNLWYGEEPNGLMGAWMGSAGCHCDRCETIYHEATGKVIPAKILPGREDVAEYLRWRAGQVTATLQELADFVHSIKPDAPINANDFDVTMRNSPLIYGLDVEALAKIQDLIMVEDFALPRWDKEPKPRLANNALTIHNTQALIGKDVHLSILAYDVGIGFDPVYPPRRHLQGIAEAAAGGASTTIKGTEYNDGEKMTMLTDPAYHAQHAAIGKYNRWLEEHAALYQKRENIAPIGLLHPEETLWRHWFELAPIYLGAGQTLTMAGIPWRVVRKGDALDGLAALLTFTPDDQNLELDENIHQIHVPDLENWAWRKPTLVGRGGLAHSLVQSIGLGLVRAYHSSKFARHLMDKLNMASLVIQTNMFTLPPAESMAAMTQSLPDSILPTASAAEPVLIETWQKGKQPQVHLMNYANQPQKVTVHFSKPVTAKVLSPDTDEIFELEGENLTLYLDIYSILLLD